jgi:flavodoxin
MRILMKMMCVAMSFLSIMACAQKKETKLNEMKNEKVLVAYFSATGTTRDVAKQLAQTVGADLFEITPETPYSAADLDWRDSTSRSSVEMRDLSSRPAIAKRVENIADYSVVFVGFPIWWYTAPTIINTFIEENDLAGKTVIPFATSGGSTIDKSSSDLKAKYPTLNIQNGRLLNHATQEDLKSWKNELGL